jgi:hypothetical protein
MMLGLFHKDILLIIKSITPIYLLPVIVVTFAALQNSTLGFFMLFFVLAMTMGFLAVSTMDSDEKAGWLSTQYALPLSLGEIVVSKYLLVLVSSGLAVCIFIVIWSIASIVIGSSMEYFLVSCTLAIFMSVTYCSITIPAIYRYGSSKGSFVFVAIVIAVTAIPFIANWLGFEISDNSFILLIDYINIILLALIPIIMIISAAISIRILKSQRRKS